MVLVSRLLRKHNRTRELGRIAVQLASLPESLLRELEAMGGLNGELEAIIHIKGRRKPLLPPVPKFQ